VADEADGNDSRGEVDGGHDDRRKQVCQVARAVLAAGAAHHLQPQGQAAGGDREHRDENGSVEDPVRPLDDRMAGQGQGLRSGLGLALPGVSVICSPTTTEPLGDMLKPTLAVIAQGVKETALNGRTFSYGAG
jgi:hypothetical protein